ncbi:MAG: hypothetical protein OSA99_16700, partial [Acidimicrobiales bacterium]|nr:hypothetical protein [Acidimicrobiales bacterium]
MSAPGPPMLGRGVVTAGGAVPAHWSDAPVVTIDAGVVAEPRSTVEALHEAWSSRSPLAIDLQIDPVEFRRPMTYVVQPWELSPDFELWLDRLHFLVWNNNYDARTGTPIWWWGRKAARIDGTASDQTDPPADGDVVLSDGTVAWVDGGPPDDVDPVLVGGALIRAESVDSGSIVTVPPWVVPSAELAADL